MRISLQAIWPIIIAKQLNFSDLNASLVQNTVAWFVDNEFLLTFFYHALRKRRSVIESSMFRVIFLPFTKSKWNLPLLLDGCKKTYNIQLKAVKYIKCSLGPIFPSLLYWNAIKGNRDLPLKTCISLFDRNKVNSPNRSTAHNSCYWSVGSDFMNTSPSPGCLVFNE